MKCRICDKEIFDKEIQWNSDIHEYEPCGECLGAIFEAAYSDGHEDDEVFLEVPLEDEDADLTILQGDAW